MEIVAKIEWNKKTLNALHKAPDVILYKIASQVLDKSYPMIPKDTHTMARASKAGGVRGSNGDYYIGSYTRYASHVWVMPDSTNWTTPGTNNKWFSRTLKTYGKTILDSAVNKSFKELF